jgi:hypothetical protein
MLNLNPATRRSLTAESLDSKTNKPTAVECDMKGASRAWIEGDFGMPGAGVGSLPAQVSPGLGQVRRSRDHHR